MRVRAPLSLIIAVAFLSQSAVVTSKEKANPNKKAVTEKRVTSVAIVPYAENLTPELAQVIKNLEKNLREQNGLRVLDQKSTSEILGYYLKHAQETGREGANAEELRQAREAFAEGNYESAGQLVQSAEARIREGIATGGTNAHLRDLLILKAKLAYVSGKKNKDAIREIYSEIVRLDPTLTFAKGLYSGWEHSALDGAKKEMAANAVGRIEITSDPKSCEVYLNGQSRGVTYYDKPLTIEGLSSGQHCLEIKTVNYRPFAECFVLPEGGTKRIDARLERFVIPKGTKTTTVSPKQFQTPHELSNLVSVLGAQMGVDKVIMVHEANADSPDMVSYQIGDSSLGAINKMSTLDAKKGSVALLTKEMKKDVLAKPGDQLISQSVGDIALHEKRRKPIYKRPLFWILTGLAAAGGGIGAIFLGAGAAAAATGGVLVAF